jgi:histidinol-phosphate aminotransferase
VSARPLLDGGPVVTLYRPGGVVSDEPSGKLSSNESYLGPGPAVIAAIEAVAPDVHLYRTSDGLRDAIAARLGVDAGQVIVTNGSDEVCYLLAAALIERGDRVVLSDPPYRIDEIVSVLNGGELAYVPIRDGGHDLEVLAAASQDAKLVWLPTPHNPTGVAVPPEQVEEFLAAVPARCWVVIDEAYRAFLPREQRPAAVRLLARHPNLIVQRTLSKSAGLAGVRVGFALGSPELVGSLERLRAPFNVNAVALAAAEASLEHPAWGEYAVTQVRRRRQEFEAFLTELGVEFWRSETNFVSLHPRSVEAAVAALGTRGISVRDGADLGLPGWIRVTIGSAPRMRLVRESLIETEEMT